MTHAFNFGHQFDTVACTATMPTSACPMYVVLKAATVVPKCFFLTCNPHAVIGSRLGLLSMCNKVYDAIVKPAKEDAETSSIRE